MNGPVILMEMGNFVHPRFMGSMLVTWCGFPEESFVIANKATYTDDKTWEKLVKVVSPGIRKFYLKSAVCVLPILFYIYLNPHLRPSNFSGDDM